MSQTLARPIPCQRRLFDIPDDVAYFNCAYISPMPRPVREAGERAVALKGSPWRITPEDFFTGPEEARARFARLIGAHADDIAIIPSVSYGMATATLNLTPPSGSRILLLADQFPSNVYPWRALAKARELEITTLPRPQDGDWSRAVLGEIDERTGIVALPHTHWTDGGRLDLEAIGERCRAVGAALAVDLTQSIGALPFDAGSIRPDYAVAGGYKWLMGPYSLGFLYVAPARQDGNPLEHNWMSREGSEVFSRLVEYRDEFQPGARRFDVGEKSNFALMPMANAALELIEAWGVSAIAETLGGLTAEIEARLASLGFSAPPESLRAGHYLALTAPRRLPADLPSRLEEEKIYVSVRGSALRITPHLYNTPADIDRLCGTLDRLLKD